MPTPASPASARSAATWVAHSAVGLASILFALSPILVADDWRWACLGVGLGGVVATALGLARRSGSATVGGMLAVTVIGLIVASALELPLALAVAGLGAIVALSAALVVLERPTVNVAASADTNRRVLEEIRDHVLLSDTARRVLFRDREIALLRDAIERDLAECRYGSATALCNEMAESFGYRQEAEAFRGRILRARQEKDEAEVRSGLEALDALLRDRQWAKAHQEAARLRRLFGDSPHLHDLDQRIRRAREEHSRMLEQRFHESAGNEDWETAYALLRELDRYLSRDDAARLTDIAQTVLVRHQELMGTRFRLAVNEHRWADAAEAGESIMNEFPGTKMAEEVAGMIDRVRTRATQSALEEKV